MKNFSAFTGCVLATFALACQQEEADPVPCSTPVEITEVVVTEAGCAAANGSLEVEASGGRGSLSYRLNGGTFQSSKVFTGLSADTYTVEVQDEEGCLASQEVELGSTSTLSLRVASLAESGCGETAGSVQLLAEGGAAAYQFSLDGETFQESATFSGLAANTYTAHVRDEEGCQETADFTITTGISFASSIQPIIQANCAVSGCHVAGTGRADFTQFQEIKNRASTIRNYTQDGIMPPPGSGKELSAEEIEAIACWVSDGAPQN